MRVVYVIAHHLPAHVTPVPVRVNLTRDHKPELLYKKDIIPYPAIEPP